ncbi:Gfo/Idh/MocA family oxidoreductase [Oculatella sp. FACHB-28]|uniref:Gfo/Idh/MocA family protein n=1 Tax=Oculatella sp. FACHB-28 TaxID=2692845 RepID=UPI001688742A|nr:Gfo/Idh/MocA family oxidoreductase [Oculatella sp. FACHB-28]MBD2055588.1 Gfo/Idh/MocA family oxidoreductase [Oculatella sp. FACHB-28]
MRDEKLGIAVFGAGRWGVHLVRNFLEHPNARLIAVVDTEGDRLNALAERFPLDNVKLSTDWEAVMQLQDVQGVAIATPATTHALLIQAALEQGHHVLSEKPLTLDGAESIKLCQLAEQHQRQLVIDHTYLFHPAVRQGRKTLQTGTLGELRYGYAARTHLGPVRQDVDALWDLAIHDIAIFNHWLNETPTQVQAQGTVWLQSQSPNTQFFPQGLSDLVWLKLIYPSGFQALVHLCWLNPDKQRRLCIAGSQGTLIFDELSTSPLTLQRGYLEQTDQYFIPAGQSVEALELEPAEPLRQVCGHFLSCMAQNRPSEISSGWVGAKLVQILSALTTSLNQGGQIVSVP